MLVCFRVMLSPLCQMDQNNLARVFGPTIIGHGMLEPSPMTIMRDTNTQPKVGLESKSGWMCVYILKMNRLSYDLKQVVARLLSFPSEFWEGVLGEDKDAVFPPVVDSQMSSAVPSTSRGICIWFYVAYCSCCWRNIHIVILLTNSLF